MNVPLLHRFDAYRLSLDFRRHVVQLLPLQRAELSDQLDRATISLTLNIAEGAGLRTPKERIRHFSIAHGSAVEAFACLDLLDIETRAAKSAEARAILLRLFSILTRLICAQLKMLRLLCPPMPPAPRSRDPNRLSERVQLDAAANRSETFTPTMHSRWHARRADASAR